MKNMLAAELKKMFHCRTFLWSIIIGTAISFINVIENYFSAQSFYENVFLPGYETLSILHRWIDGSQMTAGEIVFFTVFPLLAAMPYCWSLQSEKQSGYANQLLIRRSKRTYLAAKYVAVFLSGGFAVVSAMALNLLANMWILPVCKTLPVLVGYGDTVFLSNILFTKPWLYLFLCSIKSFFWAGSIACLGLTVSLFIHNAVVSVLFPFAVFFGGSFLIDGFTPPSSDASFMGRYEISPMQLLHAMTLNSNPAWYVWTILLVFLALVTVIYCVRGGHDEML